jgi:hypothetical protein
MSIRSKGASDEKRPEQRKSASSPKITNAKTFGCSTPSKFTQSPSPNALQSLRSYKRMINSECQNKHTLFFYELK